VPTRWVPRSRVTGREIRLHKSDYTLSGGLLQPKLRAHGVSRETTLACAAISYFDEPSGEGTGFAPLSPGLTVVFFCTSDVAAPF
jgi:hypothetical protein